MSPIRSLWWFDSNGYYYYYMLSQHWSFWQGHVVINAIGGNAAWWKETVKVKARSPSIYKLYLHVVTDVKVTDRMYDKALKLEKKPLSSIQICYCWVTRSTSIFCLSWAIFWQLSPHKRVGQTDLTDKNVWQPTCHCSLLFLDLVQCDQSGQSDR